MRSGSEGRRRRAVSSGAARPAGASRRSRGRVVGVAGRSLPTRLGVLTAATAAVAAFGLAACSSDSASTTPTRGTPLPPLPTVTTTLPPTTTVPKSYVLVKGDSLFSVAKRFHVTVAALVAANHIKDPNQVEAGQRLVLPRPVPAPKATTTTLSPG